MPVPAFSGAPSWSKFEDVRLKMNEIVAELNFFFANLDTLNIRELNADVINAGTLNADLVTIRSDLNAGAFIEIDGSGMIVNDGTQNTFTVDINGHVTMTAATIQSGSSYPKIEMNSTSELFGAYTTASKYIEIRASDAGDPLLYFENSTNTVRQALVNDLFSIGTFGRMLFSSSGEMYLETTGAGADIRLTPASGAQVIVPSWSTVFSTSNLITLQQALDAKATLGANTSAAGSSTYVGNFGAGTRLATTADGTTVNGSVVWQGITTNAHTHVQN